MASQWPEFKQLLPPNRIPSTMDRPEARHTGPRKGPDPECQIVYWDIVSVDQHARPLIQLRKAGNQRPGSEPIPRAPGVDLASGMPAFTQPQSKAGTNPQITVPWIKNAFYWDFHSPKMIKTHIIHLRGLTKKDQTFAPATFHRFLP